jgi:hypothetical protein
MRRLLAGLVVLGLVLLCSVAWILLTVEHGNAKDRRDLSDLTRNSPWPHEQLLVPDGVSFDDSSAWLERTGLKVAYDLRLSGGRKVPVVWQQHHPEPDGSLPDGEDCRAVAILTCTDLGGGFTLIVTHKTGNSTPHVALYRRGPGDRIISVTVQGPDAVGAGDLRPALTHVHHPTDAELLGLLRFPGYQTDWS